MESLLKSIAIALTSALVSGCTVAQGTSGNQPEKLRQWIASQVDEDEIVLCERQLEDDFFFVAQKHGANRLKLGARMEVTSKNDEPNAFTIGWVLQDEKRDYLVANVLPTKIKDQYLRTNEKWYAEHVQYQTLRPSSSKKQVHVTIDLNKCERTSDCPIKAPGSKSIELCTVLISMSKEEAQQTRR